jgi:orotate phosphoribosyltransferase
MESKAFSVSLKKNPLISIKVTAGHFSTSNIHISHYLDVSHMKASAMIARDVGRELALPYLSSSIVDTIVCMERTTSIGAYLAEELLQHGTSVMNSGRDICVVRPASNVRGKLTFLDNAIKWIHNRHIVLLVSTVASGRTVNDALECLDYYGGKVVGISALFIASANFVSPPNLPKLHPLFTAEDIPGYKMYIPAECEMCKAGEELTALVSSEGYTKIK